MMAATIERRDPALRPLLFAGIAAPLLYVATVAWGATLFPGYSHLSDPISSLTQAGRPGAEGLESLFLIYNILVAAFAIGGLSISLGRPQWRFSYAAILVTALVGLLMWLFPQDPIGPAPTDAGIVHIVLAGLASLATMAAIAGGGFASRADGSGSMARFSFACLVLVFVSGLATAVAMPAGWPFMGLLERITIGTFEVWLLVSATNTYASTRLSR